MNMNNNTNNFDDLFTGTGEGSEVKNERSDQAFDREAWAERKKQERADAYALVDEGTEEIAANPEHFRSYLDVQARFDRYSVTNAVLIEKQMPDAVKLADFNTWKEAGVSINKGESSIMIFEPGKEYIRDDGTKGVSMNVKKVFDISQTDAVRAAEQKKPDDRAVIKALISASPYRVVMDNEKTEKRPAVYEADTKLIYIRQGMSANNIVRSLSQEIATAKFADKGLDRNGSAFYSYCTAYIVCQRNGFDTRDYNFDRVPDLIFKGMEPKAVREHLSAIRDMANGISQDMNRVLNSLAKGAASRSEAARTEAAR